MRSEPTRRAALAAALTLALLCACAQVAGAVVARSPDGRFLGITPHAGVAPAAIPGSVAAQHASGSIGFSSNGNLDYHGGQVLHSSAPYLIIWDPTGTGISAASRALFERYFTDVAADSGAATNVYAVDRQFTDATGFADYRQTFSSATQAIPDTQKYPARDTANCPDVAATYPKCLTDGQLQAEITRLIAADGLPQGTGANAPIYFVVTPSTVNVCADSTSCADTTFCAYHSSYVNVGSDVLYSTIPMFFSGASPAQNPKACQFDHNALPQEPNADPADIAIKYLSHEDNETITDPLGTGWWDSNGGNEDGDNCTAFGTLAPANGTNPNAFLPTLGGSAASGTLFNQFINSNQYYIQSEWSNGEVNCEMRPTASSITPTFTTPSGPLYVSGSIGFDPTASTSAGGYTSVTWDFGDGSAPSFSAGSSAPAAVSHTYTTPGTHAVRLTLVDSGGNLATVSHSITVALGVPSTASFAFLPSAPVAGGPIGFDASGSSDPNGGAVTITGYAWDFGDGSTGSGVAPIHAYASPGTYAVLLTVTNTLGLSSPPVMHSITVVAPPTPAFTSSPVNPGAGSVVVDELPTATVAVKTAHPAARVAVAFDGSRSSDPDGAITSYRWSFGDGSATGSGVAPKHTYAHPGFYAVKLTVTDGAGQTTSARTTVDVAADSKIVKTWLSSTKHGRFLLVAVDGAGVIRIGSTKVRLRRAGTARFRVVLAPAGARKLREKHRVAIKRTVSYVPVAGPVVTEKLSLVLRG